MYEVIAVLSFDDSVTITTEDYTNGATTYYFLV